MASDGNENFENICSICICDMKKGEKTIETVCSHKFHSNCYTKWTCKGNTTCPLCRSSLFDEEPTEVEQQERGNSESIRLERERERRNVESIRLERERINAELIRLEQERDDEILLSRRNDHLDNYKVNYIFYKFDKYNISYKIFN
jgi:DNA repair exonuclease SbcCD ATPase subunit